MSILTDLTTSLTLVVENVQLPAAGVLLRYRPPAFLWEDLEESASRLYCCSGT